MNEKLMSLPSFVLAVFFSGILAGLFTMGTLVIQPASFRLPSEAQLLFRRQMIPRLHYLAPTLMLVSLFTTLATAVFFTRGWSRALSFFNAAIFGASIFITLAGNVPLNHQLMRWQREAPPANWTELIHRWSVYDQIRCFLCVLAFALALLAWSLAAI